MRVTDAMMFRISTRDTAKAKERVAIAQERASSGMKVSRPSDDPLASALARRESSRAYDSETYDRALTAGTESLSITDSTLSDLTEILSRARELATMGANETLNEGDRTAVAQEVYALRSQAIALGNTRDGQGRYIFAGYHDNAPAFDSSGNYVGDNMVRQLETAPGVRMAAGVSGSDAFGTGNEVIAALDKLADALVTDDTARIQETIDEITGASKIVGSARAKVGAGLNAFEISKTIHDKQKESAVTARANLVEADPFEAYSELQRAEYALQSAVQVAARLPSAQGQ